jgi:hypothetical protein
MSHSGSAGNIAMTTGTAMDESLVHSTAAMSLEQIEVNDTVLDGRNAPLEGNPPGSHDVRSRRSSFSAGNDSRLMRFAPTADNLVPDYPGQPRMSTDSTRYANFSPEDLFSRLRIEIEVDGVDQPSTIEQHVLMSAFCPSQRRYRVERICDATVTVGTPVTLRFQVSGIQSAFTLAEDPPDAEIFHYEIEADCAEWLVAGRSRGPLMVNVGEGEVGHAVLIPLKAGRLYVPLIKIYELDGAAQPPGRFENLNQGYQITALPESFVSATCMSVRVSSGARMISIADTGVSGAVELNSVGHSVAVVPADAFFG